MAKKATAKPVVEAVTTASEIATTPANSTIPANEPTITINNKTYVINALPQEIKEKINVYSIWANELAVAKREVFKLEAANRGLSLELENNFKQLEASVSSAVEAASQETSN